MFLFEFLLTEHSEHDIAIGHHYINISLNLKVEMSKLKNKVAIIAGSTRNTGEGIARMLSGNDMKIVINSVNSIEHGELAHSVEEITIAGNLKDMMRQIIAVANDIDDQGSIHTGSILIEQMMVSGT